jgi:hypothetical protein
MEDIFYNTKTGYTGLKPLIKRSKHLGLTETEVKNWYDSQPINQVFKKIPKTSNIPFNIKEPGRIFIDLIDMSSFRSKNGGYNWILSCIDGMSRWSWCFPVKHKKPEEILPHLKDLPFSSVTCDMGNEFRGVVKAFFKANDIEIWLANPNDTTKGRTRLIEGFNHNLQRILIKYMKLNGPRWVDVLDDIVANYNTGKKFGKKYKNDRELIDPFSPGDYVRLLKSKTIFTKKVRETDYSDEVYRILYREKARYAILDSSNELMPDYYLPRQLLLVTKPVERSESLDKYNQEFKQLKRDKRFNRLQAREGL